MKIAILAYQEPDENEPDVVMRQVADALTQEGHQAEILSIRDDVVQLATELSRRKPDLVFNLVESFANDLIGGAIGVAGVLDLLQLPYTGGGPGEIYLQEDKALAKKLLAYEQVLYPDFATFAPGEIETGGKLRMPLFVKPLRMDASQGIDAEKSLVRTAEELMERIRAIHKQFGDAALAEEYIAGREIYVGVLGNQEPKALPPLEMDFSGMPEGELRVVDSKAKWDETSERFRGTKTILPELEPELRARLQKVAINAYRALRVRDYGRVDLRLTESGEIFVIEVNASCYLERDSELAVAARTSGLEYPALVSRIAELALERWQTRSKPKPYRKRAGASKRPRGKPSP